MIEADGVSLIYIDRHLVHEVLRSEWFHTPLQTQTHTHTHTQMRRFRVSSQPMRSPAPRLLKAYA